MTIFALRQQISDMAADNIILKGGQILLGDSFRQVDCSVSGGRIADISDKIDIPRGAVTIDCSSFFIVPGLVDLHVHLREPGFEAKETIATGTAAAARGGFTAVCAMPNLNPVPDCPENLEVELRAIRKDARIKVIPYASITKGRKGGGEIVDMSVLKRHVAGFSDDGCGIRSEDDMRRAMQQAAREGTIIVAHCEVEELLHGGYIHDGAYCRTHGHEGICSESEWAQVARDCRLAGETGCRYHVCHVSTAESVQLIREAKARGVRVTAETCPHYLTLTDGDLSEDGRFKMNPPLRTEHDRDALIAGLEDGTIDCIVTDHAPHTEEQKRRGLRHSAMGIPGLETSFPVMYTKFVRTGRWTLPFLIDKMSTSPRRIFGLGGGLEKGLPADMAILDLDTEYTVNPEEFLTKGRSTPFEGWRVYGRTVFTIVDGEIRYEYEPRNI